MNRSEYNPNIVSEISPYTKFKSKTIILQNKFEYFPKVKEKTSTKSSRINLIVEKVYKNEKIK